MIIKIVKPKLNEGYSREEALGAYIGLLDSTLIYLKSALEDIDTNPDSAKALLKKGYDLLNFRHNQLRQTIYKETVAETRYSQFKREATTRKPSETVHKAVREIYSKIKDLKKVIEFAGRIKTELKQDNNYKRRTSEALQKLSVELKEISNTLRKDWKTKPNLIKK